MADPGVLAKFRIFRGAHVRSLEEAWAMAREAQETYERVPLDHASVLAAVAWLEKRSLGQYSPKTQEELELFRTYGLSGELALLRAQGFLERLRQSPAGVEVILVPTTSAWKAEPMRASVSNSPEQGEVRRPRAFLELAVSESPESAQRA